MVVEHAVGGVKLDVRVWILLLLFFFSSLFKITFQPFSPM